MTTTEDDDVDGAGLAGIIEIPPQASGDEGDRWLQLVREHDMLVVAAPRERVNPFTRTMARYPPPGLAEIKAGSRRVGCTTWFEGNDPGDAAEIHVHAWPEDRAPVGALAREIATHSGTYRE